MGVSCVTSGVMLVCDGDDRQVLPISRRSIYAVLHRFSCSCKILRMLVVAGRDVCRSVDIKLLKMLTVLRDSPAERAEGGGGSASFMSSSSASLPHVRALAVAHTQRDPAQLSW